jgi:hypothetical protein
MAGLTLEALLGGLARRGAPLASESALFLALECVEAIRERPRGLDLRTVSLDAEGQLDVRSAPLVEEPEALRAIGLLVKALHDPMTAGARAFVQRVEDGSIAGLSTAASELEAMLVPLNRSAARRVIARLLREVQRELAQVSGERSALRTGSGVAPVEPPSAEPTSSVDTEPEGVTSSAEGATATVLTDATPLPARLPAPPRLGSFATMPIGPSSASSEPDIRPEAARRADATTPDGDAGGDPSVRPGAYEDDRDGDGEPSRARGPRRGDAGRSGLLLALVAALLLGSVLFFVARIIVR